MISVKISVNDHSREFDWKKNPDSLVNSQSTRKLGERSGCHLLCSKTVSHNIHIIMLGHDSRDG